MKIWSHPEWARRRTAPLAAWGSLLGRLLLASVFLYAGMLKALHPQEFLLDVRSFQLLPDPWAAFVALALPWAEIIGALALLLGGWSRGACLLFGGLLAAFAAAFLQAWARDLDVTCGCFGQTENKTNFGQSLAIDAVLFAVTVVVWSWQARLAPAAPSAPAADPAV